jgi:hypothetical protein
MVGTDPENPAEPGTDSLRLPWESMDGADESAPAAVAESIAAPAEPEAPTEEPFVVEEDTGDDVVAHESEPAVEFDADSIGYESPLPAEPLVDELGPSPRGGGWTLVCLCAGVALLACCVLIPAADANRRLVYEREKLRADLESIRKQVATNDEFLRRVADDPNLAERLAQRQMKIIREGTRVLEFKKTTDLRDAALAASGSSPTPGLSPDEMSPFHLVQVAPPPPMPPYQPVGGVLAGLCHHPRSRLYLIGTGLFLMAVGLVLGFGAKE